MSNDISFSEVDLLPRGCTYGEQLTHVLSHESGKILRLNIDSLLASLLDIGIKHKDISLTIDGTGEDIKLSTVVGTFQIKFTNK